MRRRRRPLAQDLLIYDTTSGLVSGVSTAAIAPRTYKWSGIAALGTRLYAAPYWVAVAAAALLFSASPAAGLSTEGANVDSVVNWLLKPNGGPRAAAIRPNSNILQGFQIGSFEGGADAVADGVVQSGWLPNSPAIIVPKESRTRLWAIAPDALHLDDSGDILLTELAVASEDPSIVVAEVALPNVPDVGPAPGIGSLSVLVSSLQPLIVDVSYQCHREGASRLRLSYKLAYRGEAPRLPTIELALTKECTALPLNGFSLGTANGQSNGLDADVVKDGMPVWSTATAATRVVPASTSKVSLYGFLLPSANSEGSAPQVLAAPRAAVTPLGTVVQQWRPSVLQRDVVEEPLRHAGMFGLPSSSQGASGRGPAAVRVRFSGPLASGGSVASEGPLRELGIELECVSRGAALVEVELAPAPAYQPYRPVVFGFIKRCGGAAHIGFDVSTHSLTPSFVAQNAVLAPDLIRGGVSLQPTSSSDLVVGHLARAVTVFWASQKADLGPPSATKLQCDSSHTVNASLAPLAVEATSSEALYGRQDVHLRCQRPGTAYCEVKFAWPLYDGPTLRLQKSCGGLRANIDVESDVPSAPHVLIQGETDSAWSGQQSRGSALLAVGASQGARAPAPAPAPMWSPAPVTAQAVPEPAAAMSVPAAEPTRVPMQVSVFFNSTDGNGTGETVPFSNSQDSHHVPVVIPADTNSVTFAINLHSAGGEALELSTPEVHVSDSSVVEAHVVGDLGHPGDAVMFTAVVEGVDYAGLAAAKPLLDLFGEQVKRSVIRKVGPELHLEDVNLAFAAGSVVVQVVISPPSELPADTLVERLTSTVTQPLAQVLEAGLSAMPSLRSVSTSGVKVGEVSAPISAATVDSLQDAINLEVVMQCLSTGTSEIEVTQPLGSDDEYEPARVSFRKECDVLPWYAQRKFFVLAGFCFLFFVSLCAMVGFVNNVYRLKKEIKNSAVRPS